VLPVDPITAIMISFPGPSVGGFIVEGRGGPAGKYAEGIVWETGGVTGIPMLGDCMPSVSGTPDIGPPYALIRSNGGP